MSSRGTESRVPEPPVIAAGNDDADAVTNLHNWLREVSVDIVAANPNGLNVDKIATCLLEAKDEAERKSETVYRRLSTFVDGQNIVELFDEGTFGRSQRLTVIGDDVFVKLMPSAPHEVAWQWFQSRLLVNLVAVAGRKNIKIDPLGCARMYMQGDKIGKEPDGILTPATGPMLANSCPSVVVEVGVSEPFSVLTLDKLWWQHFDKQSKHGKLMLIILIDADKLARCVSIHLYTSPDFAQPRTLTLPFEGALPDGAQLEFLPEWLYCGETPDWLDGKTVVMDSADLDEWRRAVRRHLFPISS